MSQPAAAPATACHSSQRLRLRRVFASARCIAAPMVGQSDPAWRVLMRRHGAELVYTQMLESVPFVQDAAYRRRMLVLHSSEQGHTAAPLIVQFCTNDPSTFAAAAALVPPHCAGVCLNLGCPQRVARSGLYGAFLLDAEHHERVFSILRAARAALPHRILCAKIRLLPTLEQTLSFVLALRRTGIDVLTIHGRTRGSVEERRKGPADLEQIRAIVQAVRAEEGKEAAQRAANGQSDEEANSLIRRLLIWTNGNVRCDADVAANIAYTGADGCMVGEALLNDPTLFERCGISAQPSAAPPALSSSHAAALAQFVPNSLVQSVEEIDRKFGILHEYVRNLEQEASCFHSQFDEADDAPPPSAPPLPSAVASTFPPPHLVSWSSFLLHVSHLFNSDLRGRFVHHAQLVDELFDCEDWAQVSALLHEVRRRIVVRRAFDEPMQARIEAARPARQRARAAREKRRAAAASGEEKPLNSRERKRARWHERKQEEKRRHFEEQSVEEANESVNPPDVG